MATYQIANSTELINRLTGNGVTRAAPGDVLELAAGTYTLSRSTTLTFASPFVTIKYANRNNRPRFKQGGFTLNNVSGLIFDGMVFWGDAVESTDSDGVQYPNGKLVEVSNFNNIEFINCTWRFGKFGLDAFLGDGLTVRRCRFHQIGIDPVKLFRPVHNLLIENNVWDDMRVDKTRFTENVRHPDAIQVALNNTNEGRHENHIIRQNKFLLRGSRMKPIFYSGSVISGSNLSGFGFRNVTIEDNYCESERTHGICIADSVNWMVQRNVLRQGENYETPRYTSLGAHSGSTVRNNVGPNGAISGSTSGLTVSNQVSSGTAFPSGGVWPAGPVVGPFSGGGVDPPPDEPTRLTNSASHGAISGTFFAGNFETGDGSSPLHPRTVFNTAELTTIKARVSAGQQPQTQAWNQRVLPAANAGLNFTPDPPLEMTFGSDDVAPMRAVMSRNAAPAYACALAWRHTGDSRYADKAVAILDAWARRRPDVQGDTSHPGLHIGSFLIGMLYAADLLHGYPAFMGANRDRFRNWWRDEPQFFLRRVMNEKMAGWPGNREQAKNQNGPDSLWEGGNWLEAGIAGLLATGIAFEDSALIQEMTARVEDYFIGVWRIKTRPYGPDGEIVATLTKDIDRSTSDKIQGIGYTGYATSSLVQTLEMIRYTGGPNLWTATTPENVGVQDIIDIWFRWVYQNAEFNHKLDLQARGIPVGREGDKVHANILEAAKSNLSMGATFNNRVIAERPVPANPRDEFSTYTRGDM